MIREDHLFTIGIVFVCMVAVVGLATAELVTDGLVSYYTFDQKDIDGKTLKDVVGDKHGTIIGAPEIIPGHLGDAMEFGGSPDCVELPQIFTIGEGPATYEVWFKREQGAGWQYLISNKTDFNDHFFRLGFNQDTGQIRMYTEQANNVRNAFVTEEDYADGVWHHVVATREGELARIYVDAALVKEDAAMKEDIGGDKTNWFLAQNGTDNPDEYLIGAMDEVRIYRRALTPEEVQTNFESEGLAVQPTEKLSLTWGQLKTGQSYH